MTAREWIETGVMPEHVRKCTLADMDRLPLWDDEDPISLSFAFISAFGWEVTKKIGFYEDCYEAARVNAPADSPLWPDEVEAVK